MKTIRVYMYRNLYYLYIDGAMIANQRHPITLDDILGYCKVDIGLGFDNKIKMTKVDGITTLYSNDIEVGAKEGDYTLTELVQIFLEK